MKKLFQIGLAGLAVGAIAALLVYIFIYNKPHKDVHELEADFKLPATNLIEDFQADETNSNNKYLDKIILVKGPIRKIDTTDGQSVISIGSDDMMGSVICTMDPVENKKVLGLEKGQTIQIKGICTGFLLDVILVRSVIVN